MNFGRILATGAFVCCLSAGRAKAEPEAPAANPTPAKQASAISPVAPALRTFAVRGTVKEIDAKEQMITVQHETIANYMEAMTMPFHVRERSNLEGLQPGDTIAFRLNVAAEESWIDQIHKEKEANAAEQKPQAQREPFRIARDVEPLSVGDLMPDYHFTNELGRAVSLSDFKGQALAFTFIYTRCPLPDFCPRMSKNFGEVCQKLAATPNAPTNWHLLTISFDPDFDTPTVLKGYAMAFQNDPKRWNFVTGAMIDIDAITDQFSLPVLKIGSEWDHKIRTVVVDATGHIQTIVYGNEWKPDALVQEIIKAARARPAGKG